MQEIGIGRRCCTRSGKGHLTQKQGGEQFEVTERWVRKLLARMRKEGDGGILHRLRGRPSNRRIEEETRQRAVKLVKSKYGDFGPAERDGQRVPGEAGGDRGQQGESPRRPAVADRGGSSGTTGLAPSGCMSFRCGKTGRSLKCLYRDSLIFLRSR